MGFPSRTIDWAYKVRRKLSPFTAGADSSSRLERMIGDFFGLDDDNDRARADVVKNVLSSEQRSLHDNPKKLLARELFYSLRFKYGFEEALLTGNWAPWPHEANALTCYGQAVANYCVTSVCDMGFNPILVEFVGLQEEGHTMRAGHGCIVVNVAKEGQPYQPWVVDQALGMYGPVRIDENSMQVTNLAAKRRKTHRTDFREKEFGFIQAIGTTEEKIVEQMEQLAEQPKLALIQGQRVAIPEVDSWQSEKPLHTEWYLKFYPGNQRQDEVVSRLIMHRPGIKSRGLEYAVVLNNNEVVDERVRGYYCTGISWSNFVNPIPMVDLPKTKVIPLLKGLTDIPLGKRAQFEIDMMNSSATDASHPTTHPIILAAKESYETLMSGKYARTVQALSAVEALYQEEKKGRECYLESQERTLAVFKLKNRSPLFAFYAQEIKKGVRSFRSKQR
ncbi:hypothetical protein HYX12_02260, partial [Candidatus Woesearchaeota archaeon]|nr:hypothetical protein [Candidatus Woesearchaeota archaeon]